MTETTAPIITQEEKKTTSAKGVNNLFQTKWINNNLLFFMYLAVLAIAYTMYEHWTDKTIRKISTTEKELKELGFEYKSAIIKSTKECQESEVSKSAATLGLTTNSGSPIIIKK